MGRGGMGHGLAFLLKKSWHTGGTKQQEKVWEREQTAEREKKRLEELRKQIAEEREVEELRRVAGAAGHHAPAPERLEFMYKGCLAEKRDADQDAYLLGAKAVSLAEPAAAAKELAEPAAVAARADSGAGAGPAAAPPPPEKSAAAEKNEAWARLHNDPLLAMRQAEQSAIQHVRNNPARMQALRDEVRAMKDARKSKKEAKKEAKRARKEAKKAKKHKRRERSSSPSSSRSRSPPRREERERGRRRSPSADRRRDRSRSRERERRRSPSPERRRDRSRSRDRGDSRRGPPPRPAHDGASAQRGDGGYGLTFRGDAPDEARMRAELRASQSREAIQRRVEEKARADAAAAWRGGNTAAHRTGRLSKEEIERRRREMEADGDAHEEDRWTRVAAADRAERREGGEEQAGGGGSSFVDNKAKELFGVGGGSGDNNGVGSVADRLGSRSFYSQRGRDDGNAFRR